MTLPEGVRRGVEEALTERGLGRRITAAVPVQGGCINHGARVETDQGTVLFLKWNRSAPTGMFEAEADGLRALQEASPLRVPEPLTWGSGPDGTAWLLMEFLVSAETTAAAERALGRGLAEMHARTDQRSFGWERDNYIGSLEQCNEATQLWGEYWRDNRIQPQLVLARTKGRALDRAFDDLLELIPRALASVKHPQLLHGDLWAGNWFASGGSEPILIDPAVYRGHGEVDLAMSELFGGFGQAFYDAYDDVASTAGAYHAYRKDLYQLYYLLVHVNLFGGSYEAGALRAAQRVLAAVG